MLVCEKCFNRLYCNETRSNDDDSETVRKYKCPSCKAKYFTREYICTTKEDLAFVQGVFSDYHKRPRRQAPA